MFKVRVISNDKLFLVNAPMALIDKRSTFVGLKGYDKHRRALLMQCVLPSVRALNKLSFVVSKYVIYVLEGPL